MELIMMSEKIPGFVVLLAGCFIKFLWLGTFKTLGVFYMPIVVDIKTKHITLGTWIAVHIIGANLFAPLTTLAAQTYGERPLIILGGVMSVTSLCSASAMDDITLFGVCMVCAGIGSGMASIAVVAAIPRHFQGNIQTIFGLMCAAGGVGTMVCPPVFELLIQVYGWRGAMLILGALNANIIVCGALVVPQHSGSGYKQLPEDTHNLEPDGDYSEESKCFRIQNLAKIQMKELKTYLSFLFIDNPKFIAIIIAEILSGVIFAGWAIFLVPHAIARGMSSQLASFLSSTGAVGLIIGRLLMGPMIKGGVVTALQLYIILAGINAGAFALDVLSDQFPVLASLAFFNGLCSGTLNVISFGASAEVLGEEHAVLAYSFAAMCYPVGDIIGGILLGYLFDNGSDFSFLLLGGTSMLLGIVVATTAIPFKRFSNRRLDHLS